MGEEGIEPFLDIEQNQVLFDGRPRTVVGRLVACVRALVSDLDLVLAPVRGGRFPRVLGT